MKNITRIVVSTMISFPVAVFSQIEMSAFTATGRAGVASTFVTDYQCIGINPSNLGWTLRWENKNVTFSLLEGAYSIYSEPLKKPEVRAIFKDLISNNDQRKFTWDEKKTLAQNFANSDHALNIDLMSVGFALQLKKIGGFAFNIRERIQVFTRLNQIASEVIFLGYNAPYFDIKLDSAGNNVANLPNHEDSVVKGISSLPQLYSTIFNGTKFKISWMREYNLSYGRSIISNENFQLFGGVGFKYLQGIAYTNIMIENGTFEAVMAYSPTLGFEFDSSVTAQNPSALPPAEGFLPKGVGKGFGMDIGISMIIKNKIKWGTSLVDIGSITWDGNVYTTQNDTFFYMTSPGAESYNVFAEAADAFTGDFFEWKGAVKTTSALPTSIRSGISYVFGKDEKIIAEIGLDAVIPFSTETQTLSQPVFAIGGDVYPFKWLRLNTGLSVGTNYGTMVPMGLLISLPSGSWELGVASRDALSFFKNNGAILSLSMGFLRFRF